MVVDPSAAEMVPSLTVSCSAVAPTSSDASASSRARRAWADSRSALPPFWMEKLPAVTPSSGLRSVSVCTTRMREMETPSSSAAIWARAVVTPWPMSTLPDVIRTVPSGMTRTWSLPIPSSVATGLLR